MWGELVLGEPPAQLDVTHSCICRKSKVRVPAACRKISGCFGDIPQRRFTHDNYSASHVAILIRQAGKLACLCTEFCCLQPALLTVSLCSSKGIKSSLLHNKQWHAGFIWGCQSGSAGKYCHITWSRLVEKIQCFSQALAATFLRQTQNRRQTSDQIYAADNEIKNKCKQ